MSAEITEVQVVSSDITSLSISTDVSNLVVASEITAITVQNNDITVLTQSSGTINLATLNFSNDEPSSVARIGNVGTSVLAARADHAHSAANLLLDGGNY